jgi:hypothetical protein
MSIGIFAQSEKRESPEAAREVAVFSIFRNYFVKSKEEEPGVFLIRSASGVDHWCRDVINHGFQ